MAIYIKNSKGKLENCIAGMENGTRSQPTEFHKR